VGKGELLVIEGDEYKQKMVKLHPETTVITNIEEDHLDVYRDLDHIVDTFQELVDKTALDTWVNAGDENSARLTGTDLKQYGPLQNRRVEAGRQSFEMSSHGRIELQVPGAFNAMNALAAASVAVSFGASFAKVQSALASFTGIWRRFERVGEFNGATVISDYGHHPTAVKGTLAAAKEFFPGRRIVLLFEPHQHNRTKELFNDFVTSFDDADVLVLSEIYGVAGRTDAAETISSLDLLNAVEQRLPAGHPNVGPKFYTKDLQEAEEKLREVVKAGDVVIVMGAGDVDSVARNLVA
jgi:UDP-N-acetylmuramate--alanine ligase